jgi:hypothetical protein
MLIYILSMLFCLYVLTIFGLGILQFFKKNNTHTSSNVFEAFLLGLILISSLTSYASIFLPIRTYSFLIAGVLSVAIHVWLKIDIRTKIQSMIVQKRDLVYLSAILFFIAFIAADGINHYDSGLYHVQAINWIQSHAVIPGLGNLHGRLAFNSLFFPVSTLFSFNGNLGDKELLIFPLNATIIFLFFINRYFIVKTAISRADYPQIIYALIITLVGLMYTWNAIGSPTPDISVSIITILTLVSIWRNKTTAYTLSYYTIIALVFTATAYKLSSILLALAILPMLLEHHKSKNILWPYLLRITLMACFIWAPFFIRNYHLSGYVVYPFAQLDIFEVDWKIPASSVIEEQSWVSSWAKIPGAHFSDVLNLSFTSWFPIWFSNQNPVTWFALIASFITSTICLFSKNKTHRQLDLGLVLSLNLIFWLLNAPDPRFAHGLLLFGLAFFLRHLSKSMGTRLTTTQNVSIITLIFMLPAVFIVFKSIGTSKHYINTTSQVFLPKSMNLNKDELNMKIIQSTNFQYFVPTIDDRCYNQDIPCTPYPKSGLILRGPNLSSGFRITEQ